MIVRWFKRLEAASDSPLVPNAAFEIQPYAGEQDIAAWLALRNAVFAPSRGGGRDWTPDDFAREFLRQPWWRPERLLLASSAGTISGSVVGVVAIRPWHGVAAAAGVECLHWLMTAPEVRRQGIASALVAAAEEWCWQQGARQIELETLSTWRDAAAFYAARGYRPS